MTTDAGTLPARHYPMIDMEAVWPEPICAECSLAVYPGLVFWPCPPMRKAYFIVRREGGWTLRPVRMCLDREYRRGQRARAKRRRQ